MKRVLAFFMILVLSVSLCACADSAEDVVGVWTGTESNNHSFYDNQLSTTTVTLYLYADKTFRVEEENTFDATQIYIGTWEIKDDYIKTYATQMVQGTSKGSGYMFSSVGSVQEEDRGHSLKDGKITYSTINPNYAFIKLTRVG